MRIFVLNVHKYRGALKCVKVISFLLAVFILSGILVNSYLNSDRYVSAMQDENEKNLVIIDAGHGGEDPGAIGINGVYEKDLNLAVALNVGNILEERGFAVVYTRTDDKLLYNEDENIKGIRKISDLKNRCKIAAEHPNALFISIHMNSFGSSKYSGLQTYYSTANENSRNLAMYIQSSVRSTVQKTNNRNIKKGDGIYVLEHIENPGVLIECGFLTNDTECEKLLKKEYQKELSLAIVCGIIEYIEQISDKGMFK